MTATTQTFRTTLLATGGNTVGVPVPEEVVVAFGRGKRVPVVVTIDGDYTYRNTVASMGGRYLIAFSAQTRAATGRRAGDEITVRLDVDDAPRSVEVPPELLDALQAQRSAAERWAALSYSKQRAHALSVESAKTAETRSRRVQRVLDSLGSL